MYVSLSTEQSRTTGPWSTSLPPPQRSHHSRSTPEPSAHGVSNVQRNCDSASSSTGRSRSSRSHPGGGVGGRPSLTGVTSQSMRSGGGYISTSSTTSSGSRGREPLEERMLSRSHHKPSNGATRRGHGHRQHQYQQQQQQQPQQPNEEVNDSMMVSGPEYRGATDQLDSKMSGMQLAEEVRPPKVSSAAFGRGFKSSSFSGRSLKYPHTDNGMNASTTAATTSTSNPLAGMLSSTLRFHSRGGSGGAAAAAPGAGALQFFGLGPGESNSTGPHPPPAAGGATNGACFNPEGSQGRSQTQVQSSSLMGGNGRRQLTVPKSPQFSIMSWQRKSTPQQVARRASTGSQPRAWK